MVFCLVGPNRAIGQIRYEYNSGQFTSINAGGGPYHPTDPYDSETRLTGWIEVPDNLTGQNNSVNFWAQRLSRGGSLNLLEDNGSVPWDQVDFSFTDGITTVNRSDFINGSQLSNIRLGLSLQTVDGVTNIGGDVRLDHNIGFYEANPTITTLDYNITIPGFHLVIDEFTRRGQDRRNIDLWTREYYIDGEISPGLPNVRTTWRESATVNGGYGSGWSGPIGVEPPFQVFYLEFDEAIASVRNVFSSNGLVDQDYLKPSFGQQEDRQDVIDRLDAIFDGYGVVFTDEQPSEGEYSTIYIGGTHQDIPFNEQIGLPDDNPDDLVTFGLAESIDFYNRDRLDTAVVFTTNIEDALIEAGAAERLNEGVAFTIAHEAGHLLGMVHVAGDMGELMQASANGFPTGFGGVIPVDVPGADGITLNPDLYLSSGAQEGYSSDNIIDTVEKIIENQTGQTLHNVRLAIFIDDHVGMQIIEIGTLDPGETFSVDLLSAFDQQVALIASEVEDENPTVFSLGQGVEVEDFDSVSISNLLVDLSTTDELSLSLVRVSGGEVQDAGGIFVTTVPEPSSLGIILISWIVAAHRRRAA